MNVNEVAETTVGATVVPPIVTDIPAANPLPVTVTLCLPVSGPAAGVTEPILAANSWSKKRDRRELNEAISTVLQGIARVA
jgi:hypothetical protein